MDTSKIHWGGDMYPELPDYNLVIWQAMLFLNQASISCLPVFNIFIVITKQQWNSLHIPDRYCTVFLSLMLELNQETATAGTENVS